MGSDRAFTRVAVVLVPVLLALHRSQQPTLLGRYSGRYFAVLSAVAVACGIVAFLGPVRAWRAFLHAVRPGTDLSSRTYVSGVAALVMVHALLTGVLLRPGRALSAVPITTTDYAHHFHQFQTVIHGMLDEGRTWVYDTSFCAGYPEGTLFDVDMKLMEVSGAALHAAGVPLGQAFNLLVLSSFIAVPFLILATVQLLAWGRRARLLALATGTLSWHADEMTRTFVRSGMFTFVLCGLFAVLSVALALRFVRRGGAGTWVMLAAALAVTLMCHVTGALLVAAPLLGVFVVLRSRPGRLLALAAACLLALASNLWWISNVVRFLPFRLETSFWRPASILASLTEALTFRDRTVWLAVVAVWAFLAVRRTEPDLAAAGLSGLTVLLFLSRFSAPVPFLSSLEPQRFSIPLVAWSLLGIVAVLRHVGADDVATWKASRFRFPLVVAIATLVGSFAVPGPRLLQGEPLGEPDEPGQVELVSWLSSNTSPVDRLAFEDSSPGKLTGAWLRSRLDREIIGGPFSQLNLAFSYASFSSDRFFDRSVSSITEQQLASRVDEFAIRFVIAHTPTTCELLRGFDGKLTLRREIPLSARESRPVASSPSPFSTYGQRTRPRTICVFEVSNPTSLVAEGAGDVRAEGGRISVKGATSRRTVLRYHWLPTLRAVPPLRIRERKIGNQPIGFIEVENGGLSHFVIESRR